MKPKILTPTNIFLIVLSVLLIVNLMLKKIPIFVHQKTDYDTINTSLLDNNKRLELLNKNLTNLIHKNNAKIDSILGKITITDKRIKTIEKKINENKTYVNSLDASAVANAISNYIETKSNN